MKARRHAHGRNQPVNAKTRKPENGETGENAKTGKRENGGNQPVNAKTRKPENAKTAKTRKRENGENPKTAKTRKRRKPESAKTAKTRKPENGESTKAVFASSNKTLQSIKVAIKDALGWEQREMRKRKNAKTRKRQKVFSFSGFLVFSFRRPHPCGQVASFMCLDFFGGHWRSLAALLNP